LLLPKRDFLDARCGLACELENPTALARAVIDLSKKATIELESMGRSGKILYDSHLSLSLGVSHLKNIL